LGEVAADGGVAFAEASHLAGEAFGYNSLRLSQDGTTLTLGSRITMRGGTGYIGYNPNLGRTSNVSVVNHGTISADGSGGTIVVDGSSLSNEGSVQAINGGIIGITAATSNSGNIAVDIGSTINITGDFTQKGGTVSIAIAGTSIGQMGVVNISGNASLDGTLSVSFVNGFAPVAGGTFKSPDPRLPDRFIPECSKPGSPPWTHSEGCLRSQ
jgi:hypothetical protein